MNNRIDSEYWQLVWKNFKEGDRNAFQTIYNEFLDSLYSYGSRFTTDKELLKDSVQDLFLDVYTYGSKLHKPELLEFYLYTALKRIILRKLGDQNRFTHVNEIEAGFSLRFSIEDEILSDETDEQLKKLQEEINELDAQKRELLFLKFNSGLTYVEIGKILDIKPNTVKKQIYRILDRMRGKIDEDLIVLFTIC